MLEFGQGAAGGAAGAELVKDSSEATFMQDVIEASREVPVIVDFWAPWCGPCKTLGPALESAVQAAGGKVRMVKVNVDENQMLAGQMRVQSIPAVFGFVNGQPVDGFMGAQGPAQIKQFIDGLIAQGGGGGLDEAIEMAEEMLAEGNATDAAQTFAAILAEDRDNLKALGGMIRAQLAVGQVEEAQQLRALVPEGKEGDPALAAALAQLDLASDSAGAGEAGAIEAQVAADPDNMQLRLDLATAYISDGRNADAIDTLLDLFARDREWNDAAAKTQLLKLLDSLGPKNEDAQRGRRRLSSMIFA
ncbi:tetratricopeptide repeat protein [Oceanomicrobium pacificus]|uniref:Tetratricopeptide repeat protein n=1 Tax=Oceanomicrobium pacificus TaxID=2692916 RepID=A0A6B0TSN5_9RHOB|nr:tetratricopeptide repeat protein [Oceanomicrobium pacificus]MXU64815.1 tetratricopeptide repeat protein [Oceanomicrobium pacificus]